MGDRRFEFGRALDLRVEVGENTADAGVAWHAPESQQEGEQVAFELRSRGVGVRIGARAPRATDEVRFD